LAKEKAALEKSFHEQCLSEYARTTDAKTAGPRLETRAEITMMAQFADLVGMTMASEAIIAQELEIPYASLCSVDNFAHGLADSELTMEKILWHARRNAETILRILTRYLERIVETDAPR
jgi:purine nucleoside phosphorylase